MIKFFRHIRKQLLTENKTGKYIAYAIGEIILVVIGILIALQINNWNEERVARRSEQKLLMSLLEDFKSNLASLESSLNEIPNLIEEYSLVLEHAGRINNGLSDTMKADIIVTGFIRTILVDGTLTSVLGSTTLELISNDTLKRLLTSHPARLRDFKESENDLIDYVHEVQRPLFRSYINLSDFLLDEPRFDEFIKHVEQSDYESLLKNREYLNSVIGIRSINKDLLNQCRELYEHTREISLILEDELKN
ncbi:DUF6090 family protein [Eudoraea adriatica]|uniref:DUF6090 family protein n=1 Tax=Eudoraea adriatica TaxID=446681 RepID=UPI00035CEF6D|nr:DUF6090 family protein [Eudoraea adriatica]